MIYKFTLVTKEFLFQVALPEQTEPEDLSMSTGLHSNSSGSGGSPLRSPSLKEEEEDIESTAIFLQRRPMSRT